MRITVSLFVTLLFVAVSLNIEADSLTVDIAATAYAEEPSTGRRLQIRLTTNGVAGRRQLLEVFPLAPPPRIENLVLVSQRPVVVPPSRQRGREIGQGHLAVVALSSDGSEIWRTMFPDPRLLRAEVTDESGKFVLNKLFYRKTVEFSVVVPADPAIRGIVILEPFWTGTAFDLRVLGRIDLDYRGEGPAR